MKQQDSLRTYLGLGEKKMVLVQSNYEISTDVTIETTKITEVWNDSIWNEELIRSDDEVGMKKWVSTACTSIILMTIRNVKGILKKTMRSQQGNNEETFTAT